MIGFESDLAYKNDRDYIHSSTLIAEAWLLINRNRLSLGEWNSVVVDAKFPRIVDSNGFYQISENVANFVGINNASASFCFHDNKRHVYAAFIADTSMRVNKRITVHYGIEDIICDGNFSGSGYVDCLHLEAMLENVIEINKRLHLMTLAGRGDGLRVLNAYMKRFPVLFNLEQRQKLSRVYLEIKNVGARYQNDTVSTLNTLIFPQLNETLLQIGFLVRGLK